MPHAEGAPGAEGALGIEILTMFKASVARGTRGSREVGETASLRLCGVGRAPGLRALPQGRWAHSGRCEQGCPV